MICKKAREHLKLEKKRRAMFDNEWASFRTGMCPKCGSKNIKRYCFLGCYKCKDCKYKLDEYYSEYKKSNGGILK